MGRTGVRRVLAGGLHWLRVLGEDLGTVRWDPLPAFGRLRRLPHAVLYIAAFGIMLGGTAQLTDNGLLGAGLAFVVGPALGGAVILGMRRPVPAWWLSTVASVVAAVAVHAKLAAGVVHQFTWPWTTAGIIAQLLVLLLLALRVRVRVAVEALALTLLVTYVLEGVWGAPDHQSTGVITSILSSVVVLLGITLRSRREARAELGRLAMVTAEERARRTLLEERNRIARELHDVVAHHMSVISIQAQVAPHLVENPSEELKENLEGIRHNALEALTELRRVLGVLRSEDPDSRDALDGTGNGPHTPQPTLDRLGTLVENTRAAGLRVTVETVGRRRPMPPGVELSAYRIVQEALSNVLRHAPGASAAVVVDYGPYGLQVKVTNSPPDRPAPQSPGAGHGLLGMRERAAMLGGVLNARAMPDGGYKVDAFIPVPMRAEDLLAEAAQDPDDAQARDGGRAPAPDHAPDHASDHAPDLKDDTV
ncbi:MULTISPECIES: sensor histidine kinase [unclassified Streptomyces]|uniref:sensor histidine kinase n=1 Tax=unclassified Streptomyces TaxID=2593676 RepID=UPI00224CEDE5|nr:MULTISPECIES: sensor histidine kinase [unclassified Streptomyces]MCX5060279.1 sensor histidine kinase [Streptomyces sp. NBC_00452]MCX5286429.1 sensor histidine kinase [Streptomyces sp. NBC_00183]